MIQISKTMVPNCNSYSSLLHSLWSIAILKTMMPEPSQCRKYWGYDQKTRLLTAFKRIELSPILLDVYNYIIALTVR